ncbi:MAG: carbohydrate kinase family protein [Planktomarina sp.]
MILCCGEALIDMIPDATASGGTCLVPKSGGAVFNTAIALGRLGADVGLFTGVSDDMFGRQLAGDLTASNVRTDHLVTLDAPTSLAFVELTNGQASYTFYTKGAADTVIEPSHCPEVTGLDAMFFGGISLCRDPAASTLSGLMQKAAKAGVVTMIDPNIRTSFISDEAAYRARLADMLHVAAIVKLSDEDLAWLAETGDSIPEQVQSLNLQPDTLALITEGADGATIYKSGVPIAHAAAQKVAVADTIGAGDTFNAGFLQSLKTAGVLSKSGLAAASAATVQSAAEYANACAAITVSRQGANPPWASEL